MKKKKRKKKKSRKKDEKFNEILDLTENLYHLFGNKKVQQ